VSYASAVPGAALPHSGRSLLIVSPVLRLQFRPYEHSYRPNLRKPRYRIEFAPASASVPWPNIGWRAMLFERDSAPGLIDALAGHSVQPGEMRVSHTGCANGGDLLVGQHWMSSAGH